MKFLSRFDAYLCKAVLACFAVFGCAFCGLYVLADAAQRIIRWCYSDLPLLRFVGYLIAYYVVLLPSILADLLPIGWTVAVVVTVFFLHRRNEIVAFNVHGVSACRVLAPILVLSLGVGGAIALCSEVLVPCLAGAVRAYEQTVGWRTRGSNLIVPMPDGRTYYWVHSTDTRQRRVGAVVMISYDENGRPSDTLWAASGAWAGRGGRLLLRDVWQPGGGFAKGREKAVHHDELPAPVPITQAQVLAAETPADMNSASGVRALMEGMPGNRFFEMAYYGHFVRPIVPLLFVLLTVPFVVGNAFAEGGSARGFLFCLVACAAYYAAQSVCHNIGATGNLTALQAAWLPVVVFGALGLFLFSTMRT